MDMSQQHQAYGKLKQRTVMTKSDAQGIETRGLAVGSQGLLLHGVGKRFAFKEALSLTAGLTHKGEW